MSSWARQFAKNYQRGIRDDADYLDALVFGPERAPNDECATERKEIIEKLRSYAKWLGPNTEKVYKILREAQQDYEPKRDGGSNGMQLLENIDALIALETEERLRACKHTERVQAIEAVICDKKACSHPNRLQLLIGHIAPPGVTWRCDDCGARWFEADAETPCN